MCLLEGERGNRRYFEAACSGVLIQGRQPSSQSSILGCRLWRLRRSGFEQVFAKCDYECARDSLGTPAKGWDPRFVIPPATRLRPAAVIRRWQLHFVSNRIKAFYFYCFEKARTTTRDRSAG